MDQLFKKRLGRLSDVWLKCPVYFITCCTYKRRPLLESKRVNDVITSELRDSNRRHGWHIGRFVVMPDHIHFLASPNVEAESLSKFMQSWKQWTSKQIASNLRLSPPIWQKGFFDHLIRCNAKRSEAWEYIRQNPVTAKICEKPEEYLYSGYIDFE